MLDIFTRLGLPADPWQQRILTTDADRVIVSTGRRVGKTTAAAALAISTALNKPGSLVVLIDPNQAMSHTLLQLISAYIAKLEVSVDRRPNDGFILANGSTIRVLSDPHGQHRPQLVIVDEAARVSDETMAAVQLMGADRLVLLSTPTRSTGLFDDIWVNSPAGWHQEHVSADQCPRIDPAILSTARAQMRPEDYALEWAGQFA